MKINDIFISCLSKSGDLYTPAMERLTPAQIKAAKAALELSVAERRENNRAARKRATTPEFIGQCGAHGATLFDSRTGACLSCLSLAPPDVPLRLVYRLAGGTLYPGPCERHGENALRVVQNNRCVECFAESQGDPERVVARREGEVTYVSVCDVHGSGPHAVDTGRCLACYRSSPARAAARRAGRKTYHDECERCGTHEHYVSNGKCSACFTTMGVARVGQRNNPERIAARAAGLTKYQDDCDIHGRTNHHTIRGKCLQCFNSLGQPRKRK